MEEQREENESVGYCREEIVLSSKAETLVVEDANTIDSGVCDDVSGIDESPNNGIPATGDGTFDEKVMKFNAGSDEDTVDSVIGEETEDNVDDVERTDAFTDPETVELKLVNERDDVQRVGETVGLVEADINGETAKTQVKSGGEEKSLISDRNEKETCEVGACDVQAEQSQRSSVDGEMLSVAEKEAGQEEDDNNLGVSYDEQGNSGCEASDAEQEKESANNSEEDNNEMDVDCKYANEENTETSDANHSESAKVPEDSTQLSEGETNEGNPGSSVDVICPEEENGEAMDIDYVAEEHVENDVEVGGALDDACNESAGASAIQTQDLPIAEGDVTNSSVVKEMEIDERKENADTANPNSPTEDAAPGEVEPLDHNALFDPTSDITNFIDFSGVSSWSGNIQDLKTETGNVSLKEGKKATDLAEKAATVGIENESNEARVAFGAESKEASDAILGSVENQGKKDHECSDKEVADERNTMRDDDGITQEAPSIYPNKEENPNDSDYADDDAGSDVKTNGVKRKADVLSEDSPEEGRKTVSLAKVSFAQRPSFKIGACIARAASQMAGSSSVVKGSNFGDETLSVESFVYQLHCAAIDPVKEDVVSEIAAGFFLDFRNSSALQQVTPEMISRKRGRPSNSNVAGTEAFEFEEMGDTYWTDRVIHNGGEEQTPPSEKGSYQVVPVELKPAQVQRTRRPYRRRQHAQINTPLAVSDKPANFDENAPAELVMKFSEADTIPPEKSLSKMFRHFGPIRESKTEVDSEKHRARVVFQKGADAEVAYNSAGRFSIFGTKAVKYEVSHTITETFKVQPYVVSLGEENEELCPPS